MVQSSWGGEQFELPAGSERAAAHEGLGHRGGDAAPAAGGVQDPDKLLAAARSRDFKPVPLGIRTSLAFTNTLSHVQTANVGGLLPGSDPETAQVVVLSAHHDHFGIGEPDATGDRMYHGAVDNASGCAQVLAIARPLRRCRSGRAARYWRCSPARSADLGSSYYAQHPSFPVGRIAANINIDGGNIFGYTRDATLISLRKSSLDGIAARGASAQGRVLKPDQFPDPGNYYRSDQFSSAKIGVPALFFSDGTDFIKPAGGLGQAADRGVGAEEIPSASRQARRQLEIDGMIAIRN